jgi:hypothetical protein
MCDAGAIPTGDERALRSAIGPGWLGRAIGLTARFSLRDTRPSIRPSRIRNGTLASAAAEYAGARPSAPSASKERDACLTKGVGLHNDKAPGEVRVTIQLNRTWDISNGGCLILFSDRDVRQFGKVYLPLHNSAVLFQTTEKSYHAVSEVHHQVRYTLVYLFRAPSPDDRHAVID